MSTCILDHSDGRAFEAQVARARLGAPRPSAPVARRARRRPLVALVPCALLAVACGPLAAAPACAETQGYVISWFATATNVGNFKENCPLNKNGGGVQLAIRNLMDIGYSREEATKLANDPALQSGKGIRERITNRAVVNGKHVSVYNYPDAVPDPDIETVSGRYAYGFDLGGNPAHQFIDPETHQKVDNQLWRAVGCTESFRASPPQMPYPEELSWNVMVDSAPAWTLRISGADLSKDGPVTVTLDRALEHLQRNASGGIERDVTYVIDPSRRSHNVLAGEIKDGVLTIKPADVYLEGEMPYYFEIALKDAHMRFRTDSDQKLIGYWGGYINWRDFAYMYTARPANGADSIGIYHALKKLADAYPDPKSGQNRYISTCYRMEAVPAYLATESGQLVAVPSSEGLGTGKSQRLASITGAAAGPVVSKLAATPGER